jgi:hypothetical protein
VQLRGRFKYVIVPGPVGSWAILIPCCINHCDAVRQQPISAGFCVIENGTVTVDGFSDTLNLHCRPEDAKIIKLTLFMAQSTKTLQPS